MGKTANLLIPSLISLINDYNTNLRTRIKADSLFLSFDERAKKTFNKFINLSNDRFKLMKSGGKLNHIISNQKQNYSKLNKDIENDLLFNTNYTNIERKKLIKSVNELKSKEILNVRDKLLETLKQRTSIDIMLREKEILKRKSKENQNNNIQQSFSRTLNKSHTLTDKSKSNKFLENNNFDLIEKNVKDVITADQNSFMHVMESYKNLLKLKKNNLNEGDYKNINNNKFIKIYKNEFNDIELYLNENNIKVLSFNEDNLNKITKKRNEDEKFDINNLYKLKNNNYIYNNKYQNKENLRMKDISNLKLTNETENFPKIFNSLKIDDHYSKILTFNNYDMKNTIKLIKKEAYNGVILGEKFQNKKQKFDTYYNHHFPKFNLMKLNKKIKLKQFKKLIKEVERRKSPPIKKKRKLSNYERILEDYQKIYDNKKEIWKKEDKEKEIREKNKEKKEEEIVNFLLNLDDRKKKY